MNLYIVIPAYNEEKYLSQTLQSLVNQTVLPKKIIVVNDNSSDGTQSIIDNYSSTYPFIQSLKILSEAKHLPGSKVIDAFYEGFELLDNNYDVICKFDADLIFPKNYLENLIKKFESNPLCGMAGGFCYIKNKEKWMLENLTNKDHIRGALKAYKRECFQQIGGLKRTMGWDTVDELLAQYHGWQIETDESLHVIHLKPTGDSYSEASKYLQGEAFFKIRYGFLLTRIAAAKLAFRKRNLRFYMNTISGYNQARRDKLAYIVSEEEGKFIRNLRWKNIFKKIF